MDDMTIDALKRIDNSTAPQFRELLLDALEKTDDSQLYVDFKDTGYVSSAGLRVLLEAQKLARKKHQEMIIQHVKPIVMEVFDITGFSGFLNIEEE